LRLARPNIRGPAERRMLRLMSQDCEKVVPAAPSPVVALHTKLFLAGVDSIRIPRPSRRGTEAVTTAPIRNRLRALRPYEGSNPSLSATSPSSSGNAGFIREPGSQYRESTACQYSPEARHIRDQIAALVSPTLDAEHEVEERLALDAMARERFRLEPDRPRGSRRQGR
jgi:hypothetical protein